MLVRFVGKMVFVQPYDRFTEYMTQESAQKCLETPMEEGGFNEDFFLLFNDLSGFDKT